MTTKRPINIEFTGTPESGKTTQLAIISKLLRKKGFRVTTIREGAEVVPSYFKKGSNELNRWIRLNTATELLCANSTDTDIIIIDRGLIDGMIWQEIFFEEGKITFTELEAHRLYFEQFNIEPDLLFAFFIPPDLSIKRRGGEGRLTTQAFINRYNSFVEYFLESYKGEFVVIDAIRSVNEVSQLLMDNIHSILPN